MKRTIFYILLAICLLSCKAQEETTAGIKYPDPPNKPPRMPSYSPFIVNHPIPLLSDDDTDEKNTEETKTDRSHNNRSPRSSKEKNDAQRPPRKRPVR